MSASDDDLSLLVELAAYGDLSPTETAEVEALIADKPRLRAEYERLKSSNVTAAPTERVEAGRRKSGCLFGLVAFVVGIATVLAIAIMIRPDDDTPPQDPVAAVLDDASNRVLPLGGPPELVELGGLALMYSPTRGDAVLLGNDIAEGGKLFDGNGDTLATFDAGDVEVLIPDLDPDQPLTVVADE